jgi:membrane glycosyltransferase
MSSRSYWAAMPAGSRSGAMTGRYPLGQVVRLYWRHTLLGLLLGGTAWLVSPYLALWMLPVVLGLALAIPLAAFTAATGPGEAFRRLGLLRIPEEARPPATLAKANTLYRELRAIEGQDESGLARLARDPVLLEEHRRMLPPRGGKERTQSIFPCWSGSPASTRPIRPPPLGLAERAAALGDRQALDRLLALPAAV